MDSLSLPELRHPSSPTLEHWCSWFLDSKTCTISPLVLRPSDPDWITPPALLVLQLVVNRQRASSSSVTKSCLMLATPWIIACQAPLSVGFSRQEYWNGLPNFLLQRSFPTQGSNLHLLCLLHWQEATVPPGKRHPKWRFSSVQSLSRVQLCDHMDCSRPGFPVHHQLPELAHTHVH